MTELFLLAPITAALAIYLIYRLQMPAERIGLVDRPGGRKEHVDTTPLVGGLGLVAAFAFAALLISSDLKPYRPFFAGMGLLLIVGLLDDLQELGAREKLGLQVAAALVLVIWGDLAIRHLGVLPGLGLVELGSLAGLFTLVCVVGLINAVNMLDGMDGLAGGVVLCVLFWLSVVGLDAENATALALPVLLGSALVGFLLFNFPLPGGRPARVFMGDAGSITLGFAIGWFAIDLVYAQGIDIPPVTIAWVMAVPIFDTIALMLRRMMKGRSPMAPDRDHLHHIFLRAGFSKEATVYIVIASTFFSGAIGVLSWRLGVPGWIMWIPLIAAFAFHCLLLRYAWRVMRVLHRFVEWRSGKLEIASSRDRDRRNNP